MVLTFRVLLLQTKCYALFAGQMKFSLVDKYGGGLK